MSELCVLLHALPCRTAEAVCQTLHALLTDNSAAGPTVVCAGHAEYGVSGIVCPRLSHQAQQPCAFALHLLIPSLPPCHAISLNKHVKLFSGGSAQQKTEPLVCIAVPCVCQSSPIGCTVAGHTSEQGADLCVEEVLESREQTHPSSSLLPVCTILHP